MKIAELFVNLGVKGGDQAGKALTGVKTGLEGVKSMGLETKAMIAAVVYGLERMMSQSAQTGTDLKNFTTLTGMSAQNLQQWQYAARQAGVSGEELTGSLKAVQNSMTNMLLGKGAPEGMAMLANKVGFDPKRARDTMYVMQQLQKFAQQVPADIGNNMLKSFGVSDGTIAAMRRNMFTDKNFKKAPTYSDKEVNTLNKVDVAWANLGQKIQMAMGHLTAKNGLKIVEDISKMSGEVFKLIDALTKLADKLKVFELLGKAFQGWAMILNSATSGISSLTGAATDPKKRSDLGASIKDFIMEAPGVAKAMYDDVTAPDVKPALNAAGNQNINVNQTLNFQHDGKDAHKTGQSVHKAVKDTYRQMSAQSQGS